MKNRTIESTPVLIGCIVVLSLISCCYSQIGLLPGYYAYTWASGLSGPRQMCTFANGDVLVVQNANNSIALLTDRQNTSRATTMTIVASAPGLRSNIQCYEGYIYAANFTHILRWRYNQGDSAFIPDYDVVIQGIPGEGHSNHPITFDPEGRLYVSLGSNLNLDPTDYRSQIVRTPSPINNTVLPLTWPSDLQIFAGGVRNEAGLRYNRFGELWGVENGMDNLNRTDLAPELVTNNPGEELNLFPDYRGNGSIPIGKFYGYPYCFSEYIINSSLAQGPGAQWYVPGYPAQYTDDWCKNTSNVQPPVFLMPAHNAPLDIVYYEPQAHPFLRGTWPDQDAIYVALHGSWNRTPPSGYRVLKLVLDAARSRVVSSQPFFYYNSTDGTQSGTDYQYRPAGVHFGTCGGEDCLLVASDTTGDITAIKFLASVESTSQTPSSSVVVTVPTSSPSTVLSASPSPVVASVSSMASYSGVSTPSSANSDSSVSASVNPSVDSGSYSSAVPGSASRMYSSWLLLW